MNDIRPDHGRATPPAEESGANPPGPSAPLSELHAMLGEIEQQSHARRLNELANHPSIDPWVRGYMVGRIDLTAAAADPANVLLVGKHGAIIFVQLHPGLYEPHSFCLPEGRGSWMKAFAAACEHVVFCSTNCVEMLTRCPKGNLGARSLVRSLGWTYEFRSERGWVMEKDPVPASIFGLRIQDWAKKAPGLEERGHWFHERLEAEFESAGRKEPNHPDDHEHDRYVGLAYEMILGGQPEKALVFYRRWAMLAGYRPFEIVTREPLVVDIGTAQLLVRPDGDFWCPVVR